jgi:hypothetical protein
MQLSLRMQGKIEIANFFIEEELLSSIISKSDSHQMILQSNKTLAQDIINNFNISLR